MKWGIYYIEGKVVRKNPIQAFKWFKRAANNGHLKSKKEMNKLTKK
jgi:TPR repeat protein